MTQKLFWLCFWDDQRHRLSPYCCESRQEALHHGMEHVLDRELVAVFSDEVSLTLEQILDLAPALPRPGSPMWRPPEAE